jgi:hypothetical protein
MVTCSTLAIVLSLIENLQGTYKFLSQAIGKKVKQHAFTPYPMPDMVIRNVEALGKLTTLLGSFESSNRNGILFKGNKEVDKFLEGIGEVKETVLYLSLSAEHP